MFKFSQCIILLLLQVAAGLTRAGATKIQHNETKLDCGMRELALDFAKELMPDMPHVWDLVHEALRLELLCNTPRPTEIDTITVETKDARRNLRERNPQKELEEICSNYEFCIHVEVSTKNKSKQHQVDGSQLTPFQSIHDAIAHIRGRRVENPSLSEEKVAIILHPGIHSLQGRPVVFGRQDSNMAILGYPSTTQRTWVSGGIPVQDVSFHKDESSPNVFVANLTDLLSDFELPPLLALFTSDSRLIRARYPNADPETAQWGYASHNRLDYSIPRELVYEWHMPAPGPTPDFTFVDFQENPPPGIPIKNNSAQRGYNWYASGRGGVCADVWGVEADSYWCSNASQGGWAEVDQEAATSGRIQLPIALSYNTSSALQRFATASLENAIIHAWHSQSWAMHMFEVSDHNPKTGVIQLAQGGGKQGGRNWCRCDQCTYAWGSCGQHQTPPWDDSRLISGNWMIENVKEELDSPGEYFFDPNSGLLYVYPNATEDLVDLWISLDEHILYFEDVENFTISNLGLRDTTPTYHPSYDWSPPSGGDWSLHRGGAIFLQNVTDVTIRNCTFRRLDGNAVFLSRRTRNVTIEDTQFEWLGENAIAFWGDTKDYDATDEDFPMHTTVRGNVMRELGIYEKQSSGVGLSKAAFTTIDGNIMFNTPRAAINLNDMVGGGDFISGNLIFNTCRESGDHGPINSWDRQPYLTKLKDGITPSFDPAYRVIEKNFIIANYGASQGVDNDDGSSWYHIRKNLFYSAEGFKMDYGGHDSIFEDNLVMSYPYDGAQCYGMGGFLPRHGHTMRGNRCLVGLGRHMDSGCGDLSCAKSSPETDASQETIGHLWDGCKDSNMILYNNTYYTPDGKARVDCGNDAVLLSELQRRFGLESGSTGLPLPDDDSMLDWAKSLINHGSWEPSAHMHLFPHNYATQ